MKNSRSLSIYVSIIFRSRILSRNSFIRSCVYHVYAKASSGQLTFIHRFILNLSLFSQIHLLRMYLVSRFQQMNLKSFFSLDAFLFRILSKWTVSFRWTKRCHSMSCSVLALHRYILFSVSGNLVYAFFQNFSSFRYRD